MIENALYEESQHNIPRARKILEQLDSEIAPGLVEARFALIQFEKRQSNLDVVSQLFSITLQ